MRSQYLSRMILRGPYYTLCLSERSLKYELRHCEIPEHKWPAFPKTGAQLDTLIHPKRNELICIVSVSSDPERKPVELVGLLVHESVHIFQKWCTQVGEDNPATEQQAYAIQWLSQQLMWEYERQTRRSRRAQG